MTLQYRKIIIIICRVSSEDAHSMNSVYISILRILRCVSISLRVLKLTVMFIRIDENGTSTTSADQKQYNIVFGEILLIVYSIISVILLAIVVTLAIRSHHTKPKTTGTTCSMRRPQVIDSGQSEVLCTN